MKTFPYHALTRGYALGYPQPRRLDSGVTPMRLGVGILRVRDELGQPIDAYDCLIEAVPAADATIFNDFYDEHRAEEFYWADPHTYLTYEAVFDPANPPQVTPHPQAYGRWDLRFTILPTLPTEPVDMLVAHWKMNDDAADTDVVDATGNGHDGVASHNTEDMTVAGTINAGLEFVTASSRYVAVSDHADLRLTDGGTICCWVKFGSQVGTLPLVSMGYRWALLRYNGRVSLYMGTGSPNYVQGAVVGTDTWMHVAARCDSLQGRRLYVNGMDTTITADEAPQNPTGGTSVVHLGRFANGPPTHKDFDGVLDDVRFYKRPLTRA
ncbi:MAG: LamG domain-containing protein, partial [Methanocellales archaeon]|nr:LamG domain-containing protein [Methanocellales archaeon]